MVNYSSLASGTALQYLVEQLESFNRKVDTLTLDVSVIKQDTGYMKNQLNLLIKNLAVDISSIKKEDRKEEEKILLIENSINESLKRNIEFKNSSEVYSKLVSIRIQNWNNIEDNTKQFLISAEYLFSVLQKIDNPDYSPCVLQFSKALENELYVVLFKPFIDIMSKKARLQNMLFHDLSEKTTRKFAQHVISGSINRDITFGEMIYILNKVKNPKSSYLLKEFSNYIHGKINNIILKNLIKINVSLRRRSAHPEIMNFMTAKIAKKIIPEAIDRLF